MLGYGVELMAAYGRLLPFILLILMANERPRPYSRV